MSGKRAKAHRRAIVSAIQAARRRDPNGAAYCLWRASAHGHRGHHARRRLVKAARLCMPEAQARAFEERLEARR